MFQNQMLVEHSILVSLDAVPALHSSMLYLGMGQAKASSVSAIRGYCSTEGWIVYIWDAGHLDVRSGQEKRCCQNSISSTDMSMVNSSLSKHPQTNVRVH